MIRAYGAPWLGLIFDMLSGSFSGVCVLGDERAGRVEVVGGLQREGLHPGQRALGETGQGAAGAEPR